MKLTLMSASWRQGEHSKSSRRWRRLRRGPSVLLASTIIVAGLLGGLGGSRVSSRGWSSQDVGSLIRPAAVEARFAALGEKVATEGRISVLVRLRAPFELSEIASGGETARRQQLAIAQVGQQLLTQFSATAAGEIKRFRYLPLVGVRVDAAGLEILRRSEMVLDLQEDHLLRPSLADSLVAIGAPAAWATGANGTGQTVAIVDTGVDRAHPYLAGKVVAEACFSTTVADQSVYSLCPGGQESATQTGAGLPCSSSIAGCDHGTHVAGIAAARGPLISGVARESNLIAVQVFSRFDNPIFCNGEASCLIAFTTDLIRALEHIYTLRETHRIAAVNLSLGGSRYETFCDEYEPGLKLAIDLLRSAGIASIAAAGNDGFLDSVSAPACLSSAISVGSTGQLAGTVNFVSTFSNSAQFLSLLAPGEEITSIVPGGGFAAKRGTSMATPHVTGAWAMARQRVPTATIEEIHLAFANTGPLVTDSRNGVVTPRLRIDAAIGLLTGTGGMGVRPQSPHALRADLRSTREIVLSWEDRSSNEAGFRIRRRSGSDPRWLIIATVGQGVVQYLDDTIRSPESYAYQVTAFNPAGESIPSVEVRVGSPNEPPPPPTGLRAGGISLTEIQLQWRDNSINESGFLLQRQVEGSGMWELAGTLGPNVVEYVDRGLRPGTTYRYRVIAFNLVGESIPTPEVSAATWMGKQTRLQVEGGGESIDFGRIEVTREMETPRGAGVSPTVLVENLTGAAAEVIVRIEREGSLVEEGKIVQRDDSSLFPTALIDGEGTVTPLSFVDGTCRLSLAPAQTVTLRLEYRPSFPAPAGRVNNLAAAQVVAPLVTSRLILEELGFEPETIRLLGRVGTRARLIHPLVNSLAPLVVLARRDGGVEVEFTVWDPNLDLIQASYLFLDAQGRSVGAPITYALTAAIQASGMVPGQSFTVVQRFTGNTRLSDVRRVQVTVVDRDGSEAVLSGEIDRFPGRVVNVSAATFAQTGLARDSITSAFGEGLAAGMEVAAGQVLPTRLGGARILIRDRDGVDREAPLFFVAPSQVNYLIPKETRSGPARVTVVRGEEVVASGAVEIDRTSPGLFSANATGQGVASAQVVRVAANGTLQYGEVATYDPTHQRMIGKPIELGREGESLYLVLYGTGIRHRRSLEEVKLAIGGLLLPVLYAGPQLQYAGVDQVNLLLPPDLTARGEVEMQLFVEGKASNRVVIQLR
jgi:subtilisin